MLKSIIGIAGNLTDTHIKHNILARIKISGWGIILSSTKAIKVIMTAPNIYSHVLVGQDNLAITLLPTKSK